MSPPKRYAIVGASSRSMMYCSALLGELEGRHQLVALADPNPARMEFMNRHYADKLRGRTLATYHSRDFVRMLREQAVDTVIVTSIDRTHHQYIIAAMEAGCDAITEKPMTIDAEKCQAVVDTVNKTGRSLRVAFNYRYSPRNSQVKELLASGIIGDVVSVHFEWLLDTSHGADYFRRWHRDKASSGGLMVHKATHHFDLVNWWIASRPETVFGMGGLRFYGRANAEARGVSAPYARYTGHDCKRDPFALDLAQSEFNREFYLEAEKHDGYQRDQNVLGDGISIEDDMAVLVRFASGATMTYHLTAYSPWEGWRIAFNGTRGRLEYDVEESACVERDFMEQDPRIVPLPVSKPVPERISVRPHWGKPRHVEVVSSSQGGHGGGDSRLLKDLFEGTEVDPLGRAANHLDGAYSILTGICANRSFQTGGPVRVADLVSIPHR